MDQNLSQLLPLLQMLMTMPAAQPIVRQAWAALTGGNPLDLIPGFYNPNKTIGQNYWEDRNAMQMRSMFGGGITGGGQIGANAFLRGWNQLLYNDPNYKSSFAEELMVNQLIRPQYEAAAKRMSWALYNRRHQWDQNSIFTPNMAADTQANYAKAGVALTESIMQGSVNGEFYGLGTRDVGVLASQMIGAGLFDRRQAIDNPNGKGVEQERASRANRFKKQLADFARSVNVLQDVIEGPMEAILEGFEKLTGSRLVATHPGRVNAIAQGMRNVLSTGEISLQGLAKITATQYSYIAPYGGNRLAATSQSLFTAAALANMPAVEGVGREDLATAWSAQNARDYAKGTNLKWGAAYAKFLQTNPKYAKAGNEALAQAAFMQTVQGTGGIDNYIHKMGITHSELTSATARAYGNTPFLTGASKGEMLVDYSGRQTAILKKHGLNANLLAGTFDPREMEARIMATGKKTASEASDIVKELTAQARAATQETDGDIAFTMLGSIEGAQRLQEQNRSTAIFGTIASGLLDTKLGGNMLERLIKTMSNQNLGATDLAAVMSGVFGVPDREIRAAILRSGKSAADKELAIQAVRMGGGFETDKAAEDYWNEYSGYAAANRKLATTLGMTGNVGTSREARQKAATARMEIMRLVNSEEKDSQGKTRKVNALTRSELDRINKAAGNIWTKEELDRIYLESGFTGELAKTGATDQEFKTYLATRDAWVDEFKSDEKGNPLDKAGKLDRASKLAAWRVNRERQIAGIRARDKAAGLKTDEKAINATNEKQLEELGLNLTKDQLKRLNDSMLQDNSVEGILQRILNWLESRPAPSKGP